MLLNLALWAGFAHAEIQVVAVYEGQREYLQAALAAESPDLVALAKTHIVEPYLDLCTAGLSAEDRASDEEKMGLPIMDLEELATIIDELENRGAAGAIQAYLEESTNLLPTNDLVTVCVEARDPAKLYDRDLIEKMTRGVAGQYYGAGIIWVSIYPFSGWFDVVRT
ncbi:MAG: hypothetical protein HKN13_08170, partial [Rhodothermales bacterium]|nr:hypothetical protein [Rhodothermales bacterium]